MRGKKVRGGVLYFGAEMLPLLGLAVCFLLGALAGKYAVRWEVLGSTAALQTALDRFVLRMQQGELLRASLGGTLFSYYKYPVLALLFGFTAAGVVLLPAAAFYQGFALSFAVCVFLRVVPEGGLLMALPLFGLRCAITLPCFFFLAGCSLKRCGRKVLGGRQKDGPVRGMAWRCALCCVVLLMGALFEYLCLPPMLSALF